MDTYKAKQLEIRLRGTSLMGYTIIELINNGKSAAVFKAEKDKVIYAIKIFDNDLIERFGHEIQEQRIEQELTLKNHRINNLVKIYEGAKEAIENEDYYFIVLEFIDGLNLKQFISKEDYDLTFINQTLQSLLFVTEELIKKGIVHRDIKPENIMISKDRNLILMDLGVLKFIGARSISDEEEKQFVGTLRYAPPEFLTRDEQDTEDGWRAVNLYQIGAVLHDLITKQELFVDAAPYPKLVLEIKEKNPKINSDKYPPQLIQLARNLLTKNWKRRLEICETGKIISDISSFRAPESEFDVQIQKIRELAAANIPLFEEIQTINSNNEKKKQQREEIAIELMSVITNCFANLPQGIYNNYLDLGSFQFESDSRDKNLKIQNRLVKLSGTLQTGYSRNLYILIRATNDETMYAKIELLGILSRKNYNGDVIGAFYFITKNRTVINTGDDFETGIFKTYKIFEGIVNVDPEFSKVISLGILKLIRKGLSLISPEVNKEMELQKLMAEGKSVSNVYDTASIIINSL